MIKVENITCKYKNGTNIQTLFEQESFEINQKDFIIISGPSGSGKSSLLKIVSGMLKPNEGKVYWQDKDIYSLTNQNLSKVRLEESGFIYQDFMLIDELTVLDNIKLVQHLSKKINNELIEELIKKLSLEKLLTKYPPVLSGGEKQRVAIARALANNPKVLFCDEPTGALDFVATKEIMDLLQKINQENNVTIILVTHEQENLKYATRIIKFDNGKLKCD
ncbi:MAG: ATP-binding cassette domain-containing protein [Bacilli bacterium]|nr:ATP-binding cassette domain-containing protein [Bacilli bacterium]